MVDNKNKNIIINRFQKKLDNLKDGGLFNTIRILEQANKTRTKINGQNILNFNSNNFLGFANDPKVIARAKKALDDYGVV